ncbi:hypothetical protein BC938DRAFT_481551 [Jimgerdemannia flammicorona]|uniref:DML1/Misato tubulin domain-containing protein n=1 Tax=Jimgerdemannia flammicorona TaxID=994334 RepID=A0A433QFX7_9FUNG|nr:hypothetical protein BC938DRAFT_481551 [Jimgerdemannia flammicorona]
MHPFRLEGLLFHVRRGCAGTRGFARCYFQSWRYAEGGFGSLKKFNKLFEDTDKNPTDAIDFTWDQNVQQFAEEEYPKNEYLQNLEEEEKENRAQQNQMEIEEQEEPNYHLDEQVHLWSDYNRIFYHPRSFNQLTQYQLDNDFKPFDVFSYGRDAYDDAEKELETYDENFRFFAEECDAVQGFQFLTTTFDGFGGFATSFLETIRDDYPKTSIVTFGFSNPGDLTNEATYFSSYFCVRRKRALSDYS